MKVFIILAIGCLCVIFLTGIGFAILDKNDSKQFLKDED